MTKENEFNKWQEIIEISDKENTEWITVAGSSLAPMSISGGNMIIGKALTNITKGGLVSIASGSISISI